MTKAQTERLFARVRKLALALPEAKEVMAWGHPTFRAPQKMFAAMGVDIDGQLSVGLLVGFDRQEELLKDKRFFPTPYAAHRGWVTMKLDAKSDFKLVAKLLKEAWRRVAPKRLVKSEL